MPQNYSQSGTFWIYGDSLGRRLYTSVKTRPLCKLLYKKCGNSYIGIDQAHKGLNSKLKRDIHFSPELVIETVVNALRSPEMQQEESVLLLNLVVHYAKKINFTTYQSLIDDLILALKASEFSHGERVPKYKAKIIWKSSTAICKEKASSSKETDFRFFTSQVCSPWFASFSRCKGIESISERSKINCCTMFKPFARGVVPRQHFQGYTKN